MIPSFPHGARMTRRRSRGYTAIEVLVALTLFAVGTASVLSLQRAAIVGASDARRTDVATAVAKGLHYVSRSVAQRMADSLTAIRETLKHVLPRLGEKPAATDGLIADIKGRLAEWHASAEASQDCPLPTLFAKLEGTGASIGQFHDALRQLHDDHQIYLHPWTGALYAMPDPAYALLVGHEIAYYASTR